MTGRPPAILALLCLAAGCAHDVSLGGPDSLVRVDGEPAGPECERGGAVVHTGLDRDGDLYLDDDEVASSQYVCNGSAPVACQGGTIIDGSVSVHELAELAQLDGVHCVDGDLLITGLDLATAGELDLAIVTGDLVVVGNHGLTDLTALAGVREVGGVYLIQGNDDLADLRGLERLERARALSVIGNRALTSLHGLDELTAFGGRLEIANNQSLADLGGLDRLTLVEDTLSIRANPRLASLDALAALEEVIQLELISNGELTHVALPALEDVRGRLTISGNSRLAEVRFPRLITVGEFLRLEANPDLASVAAPELFSLGNLTLADAALTSLELPALLYVTGRIELSRLPSLAGASIGALESIGGDLVVYRVSGAAPLTGLGALEAIGGDLIVRENPTMVRFTGLGALERVSGDMTVTGNVALPGFAGLEALASVFGDLTITDNPSLTAAAANALADDLEVGGEVKIDNND